MQTMAIKSVTERTASNGRQFWNVELGTPDGSTLLASIWEPEVRQALGDLRRANVEIERNAKGYAKITAVSAASGAGPTHVFRQPEANPASGYRYLALDVVAKLFQGAGIGIGDTIDYAEGLAYWMEHGKPDVAPGDEWEDN